jgi:hypothetical protein
MTRAIHQLHCSQILRSQCARTFSVHHDYSEYLREYVPTAWADRPRVGRPSMNSITSCFVMPPLHRALPHAAMSTIRILPDASARTVSPRPAWARVRGLGVKVGSKQPSMRAGHHRPPSCRIALSRPNVHLSLYVLAATASLA